MSERPDVVDADLEPWEPVPLRGGFVVEDALVRDADWSGVAAAGGAVKRSRLAGVRLSGARMRSLRLVDAIVSDADLSNVDWGAASLQRVVFERCRMTGFGGAELQAENVVFRECALELANLRGARLRGVAFEDCGLDDADLASAVLREVRFERSHLRRVLIDGVRLTRVDFRGSRLEPEGDVAALRGAIIDALQLMELGPLLAAGLGITVRDG